MSKIAHNMFLLIWACAVLGCCSNIDTLDFELTDEPEMVCADRNTDNVCSSYSNILDSLPRANLQNDANGAQQNVVQESQAPGDLRSLDAPGPSNTVNDLENNEDFSGSASLSLPRTSTSTGSSISSVQVQSTVVNGTKRINEETERTDGEQKTRKRRKTKTTGSKANTALMGETKVRMAVKKFNRCFRVHAMVWSLTPSFIVGFAEDLAQRGLTSVHSREIVEKCTVSEKWLGQNVFWRMLLFFVDTLSLEVAILNQAEEKKTVVLRDRIREKPLSECRREHICKTIAKARGAKRMEIKCTLNFLERRSTADVPAILKWLLHHVNIRCVGITCNLTEAGMNSAVLGRYLADLTIEWRGSRARIDSIALHFNFAQYKDAAVIVKEFPDISVLKLHIIATDPQETGVINQVLEALLLHCPALEQLSVFGIRVGIIHIQIITAMLPQLVLLEVGVLDLEKLGLGLEEEKEAMPVFPGLKTLKTLSLYNYSDTGIEKFASLFLSLEYVQISANNVASSLIDVLSKLRFLRSLEIVNGLLSIEPAECLLEKLPSLECLSVGVYKLDNKLAHVLSKYAGMHILNLRGYYTTGFLASLLQPSPLMNTLKVLSLFRHSNIYYKRGNFSTEDISSKDTAMENFGCAVKIRQ
ncbi:hypothetical protein NECID01_0353 [Nematocida sp. AWRm77]|nr:hypothetical protein NECID01_0353 [Nematocida sp. AWRm77]